MGLVTIIGLFIVRNKKEKHETLTSNNKSLEREIEVVENMENANVRKSTSMRLKRYEIFREFYSKSVDIFKVFEESPDVEDFRNFNMLSVCPGSRAGGQEEDMVEMFWGQRLMDAKERITMRGKNVSFEYEYGASVVFIRKLDGFVSIYLIPSHYYGFVRESQVLWKESLDPKCLLSKCFQRKIWNTFMAYSEVTSTDGTPTIYQRIRVWWIRIICPQFFDVLIDKDTIKKEQHEIRLVSGFYTAIRWIFQVAMSGLLIFLIQIFFQNKSEESTPIELISMKVDSINNRITEENLLHKAVCDKLDSIEVMVDKIHKSHIDNKALQVK